MCGSRRVQPSVGVGDSESSTEERLGIESHLTLISLLASAGRTNPLEEGTAATAVRGFCAGAD